LLRLQLVVWYSLSQAGRPVAAGAIGSAGDRIPVDAGAGLMGRLFFARQRSGDPTRVTAGNFLRAVPIAAALSVLMVDRSSLNSAGFWYAVASGALASGIGYAIWYTALPALKAAKAATVQLSVRSLRPGWHRFPR